MHLYESASARPVLLLLAVELMMMKGAGTVMTENTG